MFAFGYSLADDKKGARGSVTFQQETPGRCCALKILAFQKGGGKFFVLAVCPLQSIALIKA